MFQALAQFFRIFRISYVLIKHGLDEVVLAMEFFHHFRFVFYLFPWNWRKRDDKPRGERIRLSLEELGPIFVKFGQTLSTRRDLLPEDIADELAKLQDRVPPFSQDLASEIIEASLGKPTEELFKHFEKKPLASASVAQVHAATLPNGDEVVVKVLRPGVRKTIRRDLGLLRLMARLIERYSPDGRRLRPKEVVSEFKKVIYDELNLQREAANASQLRRNFEDSKILYVPKVYWPMVRENVMVIERVYGTPVANMSTLKEKRVNLKRLAERGVEIFFTQVFRDCFFHADMHPGNIFVSLEHPNDPQYIAIDFGIMGTLEPDDQRYLAENFLAFFNRDYRRVAELHVESGWVPADTRVDEFESAIRTVSEPIFERPLKEISFGKFLLHLFQTARRFNMEIQPQLVLLQKTLLNVEGLGRQLYPDLDLWKTAKPYLEEWMEKRTSPKAIFNRLAYQAPYFADKLPKMPELLLHALENRHTTQKNNADKLVAQVKQEVALATRKIMISIVFGAFLVGLAIVVSG